MNESITILRDLLLVRKIKQEAITSGGILLPSNEANDEPIFWDVIEVGKKVTDVNSGDKIVTHNLAMGQPFYFNGENLMIIRWKNVFGVFENGTECAAVY